MRCYPPPFSPPFGPQNTTQPVKSAKKFSNRRFQPPTGVHSSISVPSGTRT